VTTTCLEGSALKGQEIFNTVGKKSADDDSGLCRYRSKDGLKCAVGGLLTDEEYFPEMEGHIVWYIEYILPLRLVAHLELIRSCQNIHDDFAVDEWPSELRKLAKRKGLEVPEGCQ